MRLIDADELIEHVWRDRLDSRERIVNLVESMPTIKATPVADVIPVVHGRWIPHKEISREYIGTVLIHVTYDYWLCDTCGYRVENGQPMYNFCPNCGAKMDGGKS